MNLILADTSVWASHLRNHDPLMVSLMDGERLLMHPYVIGELSMGNLHNRAAFILALRQMEGVTLATDSEVSRLVEDSRLYGTGIGWIDAHLLASTLLTDDVQLWSHDRRLSAAAGRFGRATQLNH